MIRSKVICDLILHYCEDNHNQITTDHTFNPWLEKHQIKRHELHECLTFLREEGYLKEGVYGSHRILTIPGQEFIANGGYAGLELMQIEETRRQYTNYHLENVIVGDVNAPISQAAGQSSSSSNMTTATKTQTINVIKILITLLVAVAGGVIVWWITEGG